ncbi:nucleotide-binding protein [Stenotrophomonas maltophilia]|nr:nucleotide-binding protein [Stenotrophomonas maltophilia]EKT4078336.1 nucleotide-binding protein [Stenotrophomonas maltophilia]
MDLVRSEEEYRALADGALDRELERAKAGLTPSVSSRAAARFLGVHVDTLGQWRRRTPPLGPAFQKGAGNNEGGSNQHVRYLISDLEEWQSARTGRTVKERRLVDELERVKQRARELEMELELQSLREQVARMTRRAGRVLALDTVKECIDVRHEWIFKNGLVVGHVLAADEGVLVDALNSGNVLRASLKDVLVLPWSDNDARSPFAAQIESVFSDFVKQLSREASAQRMRDLDGRLPPPQESSRTVL